MHGSSKLITAYPSSSERLSFLRPSLVTMFSIMDSYIEKYDRVGEMDRPYFYNERATLSIFAGAIWRSNPANLVLEEYCSEKGGAGARYRGRFDIWFEIHNRYCFAEAKQCWPTASTFNDEQAKNVLTRLCKEAKDSQDNVLKEIEDGTVQHALGILFITPLFSRGKKSNAGLHLAGFEKSLGDRLAESVGRRRYDVLRGSYLRRDFLQDSWFDSLHAGAKIYPGVEVLICERMRSA